MTVPLPDNIVYSLKQLAALRYGFISPSTRWGAAQIKRYQFLLESQWWSRDQLHDYQWRQLQKLLVHAYENTVFYRKRFDSLGAHPKDIKSAADFRRLPCVTKDDVRNSLPEMQAANFEQFNPVEIRTGGSTGSPLYMFKSRNAEIMRVAVAWRTHKFANVDYNARKIYVNQTTFIGQRLWYADFRKNALFFNTAQVDDAVLLSLVKMMEKFRPECLVASIGFVRLLGEYIQKMRLQIHRLKGVFVIGEAISPLDRHLVEQQLESQLYDVYGMRENAVSASECAFGNMHINSEFTMIEFEPSRTAAMPDQSAAIVGTNLHNLAVPLIRYATDDLGRLEDCECPCGRRLPVMKIEGGRSRDFLKMKDGYVFVSWHLAQLIDKTMGIAKMQLHQIDMANLTVRIVKRDNFSLTDEAAILERLRTLTRNELRLQVQYVEDIPRTRLGKYRFVISDLADCRFEE